VLENLPIMLTSPQIWEALGLPLTPFEDSINFFADPGAVDEDTIRPFVAIKAKLIEANCDGTGACTKGDAVIGSNGQPVIGFATAPIDIPNCERCHSAPAYQEDGTPNVNSPNYTRRQEGYRPFYGPAGETLEAMVDMEIEYWKAYYDLDTSTGDTDWYARLKGAAVSIEVMHDYDMGTNFMANYPVSDGENPLGLPDSKWLTGNPDQPYLTQNTRMGHGSIICQKCHADNVIAVVKSAGIGGYVVPPISEAMHNAHAAKTAGGPIDFDDSLGRFGGCQGCHPAHRSDGVTDNYPITRGGANTNAASDNRLGAGGCFVGRDVHSNPLKDVDGAETPEHLNAVGQWLKDNVARNQEGLGNSDASTRGIWCTNCHTQLSQEIWRTEDCNDLIHGDCKVNPRGAASLSQLAGELKKPVSEEQVIAWLDPTGNDLHGTGLGDFTHAAWNKTPKDYPDAGVATIELGPNGPVGTTDADGDFSVNILSFCTTDDCVNLINANKSDQSKWRYPANPFIDTANTAVPVPFSAADDARDHWLSPGEPHCADCHTAPYVEQSGNITAYPPFNYPAKASLMRYTRGHQDISCQSCHESIHGLYPVGAAIDNTSYAQAAALNADGSHGPLKCGACHRVDSNGIPTWIGAFGDGAIGSQISSFDDAVGWAHTYTAEANVLNTTCQNCHGVNGSSSDPDTNSVPADWTAVADNDSTYLQHADIGLTSRQMMDKAETLVNGSVYGSTDGSDGVCLGCHVNRSTDVACNAGWREHLTQGRVAESVWEQVSITRTGGTCGW
jgi:mono/diheme cytochrome c family protein